jgi:N-acetylglucosaminyldiphosphoundecaprenol N-acetyl-beta-D-mannosaminyltransferase
VTRAVLGHLPVDALTMDEAVDRIVALVRAGAGGYVVTPNVDHVVLAERDLAFRHAYAESALSLADGMPVVWASRLLRAPLPAKISGSDLVTPLLERAAQERLRLWLLGGGPGAAERAATILAERHPGLVLVGTNAPRIRGDEAATELRAICAPIRAAQPDLIFVCLGAPKQERFMHAVHRELSPAVMLGLGAVVDFVAGNVRRAPRWMSDNGLEWAYRLAQEPRRMWRRYLLRDPEFAWIVARDALYRARGR